MIFGWIATCSSMQCIKPHLAFYVNVKVLKVYLCKLDVRCVSFDKQGQVQDFHWEGRWGTLDSCIVGRVFHLTDLRRNVLSIWCTTFCIKTVTRTATGSSVCNFNVKCTIDQFCKLWWCTSPPPPGFTTDMAILTFDLLYGMNLQEA